jgi:large subunit ribosomal protein L18
MREKIEKIKRREKRKKSKRVKVFGTKEKPRLCVFRSLRHIYAQIIDDTEGKTLVSASDLELKKKNGLKKVEIAREVGKLIAKKAIERKIERVAFDRSGYKYHGRVKALAEGAREGGLKF